MWGNMMPVVYKVFGFLINAGQLVVMYDGKCLRRTPPNNDRIFFRGVHRGKTRNCGLNSDTYSLIVDYMICIMAPLCIGGAD